MIATDQICHYFYGLDYWSNDWGDWSHWMEWQGIPGDMAWTLEHALGLPCQVLPLAYAVGNDSATFFRCGGNHFTFKIGFHTDIIQICSYTPHGNPNGLFRMGYTKLNPNEGVMAAIKMYEINLLIEYQDSGRNRWIEQLGRGGTPDSPLLIPN